MTAEPVARIGVPSDWELWREIRLRALEGAPEAYGSTYDLERTYPAELWQQRLAEGNSVLVLVDGRPVAIGAGFRDRVDGEDWFHVVAMWTDPEFRGRKLSHRVLDVLISRARALGLPVHLDVALGNAAALASYVAYGFVPVGKTFVEDEERDLVCQRLALPR